MGPPFPERSRFPTRVSQETRVFYEACAVIDCGKSGGIHRGTRHPTHPTRSATGSAKVALTGNWLSIHAPHTECDVTAEFSRFTAFCFQSTHPTRSATVRAWPTLTNVPTFNPRTPHGVRPAPSLIRSLPMSFNPRTPHGVRHAGFPLAPGFGYLSIHAPHTECDLRRPRLPRCWR